MNETLCWFWISRVQEIGIKSIRALIKAFGSIVGVYEASEAMLQQINELTPKQIACILNSRDKEQIIEEYNKLKEKDIYFVTKTDQTYPAQLKNIYEAPYFLYYKGTLPNPLRPSVAIIGARNCTSFGKKLALSIASDLARYEVQVISGLARGIDSYAHHGAIEGDGLTYGVLGCGVDICYPPENTNLFNRIQTFGGIISEFPIGAQPLPYHFPMRNRIIAGLSDAILVIEARESSGTFITVDRGLEQGKDILAIPGRLGDSLSSGCNRLIQNGAKLVIRTEDIIEELRLKYDYLDHEKWKKREELHNSNAIPTDKNNNKNTCNYKKSNIILEREEKIVYDRLSLEPKHLESLLQETKLPQQQLMCALMSLELKHLITQWISNYYILNA